MEIKQRTVTEIPVLYKPNMTKVTEKEKVTYYARVSTEFDTQEESYERQKEHFIEYIKAHNDWDYVEGYADQGITGTKAEARPEFMRMINDARSGKITKILVKSISRFARNTVDTLKYVRELKELGVSVYFETQNIDTLTTGGEVLLTILAAMAEQESRTISSNIKWSYQKRFKDGKVLINCAHVLGYKKENNEYVIVEEEADVVRRIYREYITGSSIRQIASGLNNDSITTKKKNKWTPSAIENILKNEKYTGNAILGKTFKPDVLSKGRIKNIGQAPSYYAENTHPAIINKELYDRVQVEMKRRVNLRSSINTGSGKYSSKYPLSGMLVCSECGGKFRRFGRKLVSGEYVPTWICVEHQKNPSKCHMLPLKEKDIMTTYIKAMKELFDDNDIKDIVIKNINEVINSNELIDVNILNEKLRKEQSKVILLFKQKQSGIISNEEYKKQYESVSKKIEDIEDKIKSAKIENSKTINNKEKLENVISFLKANEIKYDDPIIMKELISKIIVINKNTLEFILVSNINESIVMEIE